VAPDSANPSSKGAGIPSDESKSGGRRSSAGSGGPGRSEPVQGPGAADRQVRQGSQISQVSEGARTAFERWGGKTFFDELIERFYAGVVGDPLLRPLYPEDLTESKVHLALFFMQYWGGPRWYSEQRGHPRLRMRHAPFAIGAAQAEAWLRHMNSAVREAGMDPSDEAELLDYLDMAARSLINTAG
jgi:hemoglobin